MQQTIHGDKFSPLLLAKENPESNSSLRFYYAVSVVAAVPFLWESQPGKPKSAVTAATIPPLTPPPSFHSKTSNKKVAISVRSHKHKLFKLRKPSSSSSFSSSSNSDELEDERGGRRGFHSVAMIKNMLLEIVACAKFL